MRSGEKRSLQTRIPFSKRKEKSKRVRKDSKFGIVQKMTKSGTEGAYCWLYKVSSTFV